METSFVTVAIPFDQEKAASVKKRLAAFGNLQRKDAQGSATELRERLRARQFAHFLSINVLEKERDGKARLLIELTADGAAGDAMGEIGEILSQSMPEMLEDVGAPRKKEALVRFLSERNLAVGPGWFSCLGLPFNGTPGMSVVRIDAEAKLARDIQAILAPGVSALETLERVRSDLWARGEKWAFVPEPVAWLSPRRLGETWSKLIGGFRFAWPLLAAVVASTVILCWYFGGLLVPSLPLVAAVLAVGLLAWRLRREEARDRPVDASPSRPLVEEIMAQENHAVQNHLYAVSTLKPGRIRPLTLRLVFTIVRELAARSHRPGFLSGIGSIYAARWVRLPGTNSLVFLSNYDGSWESYLEDFIEQAHEGLTGIWSNTRQFPRTEWLFKKGATDGDRFKRWARRQQRPTSLWYSAYPELTTARIRLNAVIRQGLANVTTEAEAADWLSCFASAPRSPSALDARQIPTLVFGALSPLPHAQALVLSFDEDGAGSWLHEIAPMLTWGDKPPAGRGQAVLAAFSARGLQKLGLRDEELATFSPAFQDGMAQPWRSRVLGDVGANAPENWLWGGPDKPADAIVLLYAHTQPQLKELADRLRATVDHFGHRVQATIAICEVQQQNLTSVPLDRDPQDRSNADLNREAFGFADGISQPIIRGTKRWTRIRDQHHYVAPGEIVLGYPDNRDFVPPSPTVPAARDAGRILPSLRGEPFRDRPDFTRPQPSSDHDLGRDGTFLVVRQLEQDVGEFGRFLDEAAKQVDGLPFAAATPEEKKAWIAAKLVGRWQDGTSLVRYPNEPGTKGGRAARPDNDFLYGSDDPDGRRCPLGAHVRRVNPRDSLAPGSLQQLAVTNRHRILRVGRSYDPQASQPSRDLKSPGLFFMCLNADIERQFEFVQQSWAMGPSFHGLDSEVDCFSARGETERLTIPTDAGPLCLKRLSDFVRVAGGEYFFMPGRRAVRFLSEARRDSRARAQRERADASL